MKLLTGLFVAIALAQAPPPPEISHSPGCAAFDYKCEELAKEKQKAETERTRAETERLRVETEATRAETLRRQQAGKTSTTAFRDFYFTGGSVNGYWWTHADGAAHLVYLLGYSELALGTSLWPKQSTLDEVTRNLMVFYDKTENLKLPVREAIRLIAEKAVKQ